MKNVKKNPYDKCPTYETQNFLFRLVEVNDAKNLLECYSDPKSSKLFNSDNCTGDFICNTEGDVAKLIEFWIDEYNIQYYVRFAIVDKNRKKAIGTIEMFAKNEIFENIGTVGVLRLDLASNYEKSHYISEILSMIENNFYNDFEVDNIITKSVPEAKVRSMTLENNGFKKLKKGTIVSYDDYYIKHSIDKRGNFNTK